MAKRNQVRIIGGRWRRRLLEFPSTAGLRPTPDRVRETLFNWLGQTLEGKDCLDLFAGSGSLGFEAASRAARRVVMIEQDRAACAALRTNIGLLRADNVELHCQDAFRFLGSDQRIFDLVFLDPPYQQQLLPELLTKVETHLGGESLVYLEADHLPQIPAGYQVVHRSRAGQVNYLLLESADHGSQIQ